MASILRRVSTNPTIQAAARPSAAYLKSAVAHPRTIAPMWRFMTTGNVLSLIQDDDDMFLIQSIPCSCY